MKPEATSIAINKLLNVAVDFFGYSLMLSFKKLISRRPSVNDTTTIQFTSIILATLKTQYLKPLF
jgi:hypothetical protein